MQQEDLEEGKKTQCIKCVKMSSGGHSCKFTSRPKITVMHESFIELY